MKAKVRLTRTLFIGSCMTFLFSMPLITRAYNLVFDPGSVLKKQSGLGAQDPAFIVFSVINTALVFLGSITLIMVIVAGFMWLTAAGSEEKVNQAKDILKGAIMGLVIVMSSYGAAQYIFRAIQFAITQQ